jgi:hypothetical protein
MTYVKVKVTPYYPSADTEGLETAGRSTPLPSRFLPELTVPQSRSGSFEEEKNIFPTTGLEPLTF